MADSSSTKFLQGTAAPQQQAAPRHFLLPSMFTVANLLCGYYAVVASFMGDYDQFDRAAKAIACHPLRFLDGRVAR